MTPHNVEVVRRANDALRGRGDDIEVEALVEVSDYVVALVRLWARARGSGLELDHHGAHLYGLTGGKITSYRPFTHPEDALEAAGLENGGEWRAAIETLIRSYLAWNERDVDAMMRNAHPGAELVPIPQAPDLSRVQGGQELEEFMSTVLDVWEEFSIEPLVFTPVGSRLLVEVDVRAKATDSGIELVEQWAHIWTLRDGKVERIQGFATRAEALEALAYPDSV